MWREIRYVPPQEEKERKKNFFRHVLMPKRGQIIVPRATGPDRLVPEAPCIVVEAHWGISGLSVETDKGRLQYGPLSTPDYRIDGYASVEELLTSDHESLRQLGLYHQRISRSIGRAILSLPKKLLRKVRKKYA